MREIVLDTETTGRDPGTGDRIVEIAAIELLNCVPTGVSFQTYLDPGRDSEPGAFAVHGLSREFLTGQPLFAHKVDEFLAFIGDAPLVIHNAEFDIGFLNAELRRCMRADLGMHRVVDTLHMARRRHPGASNSLDALCARYGVDLSRRQKHSALVDVELLAEVYIELTGGRQSVMLLSSQTPTSLADQATRRANWDARPLIRIQPSAGERTAHLRFVETLGDGALWLRHGFA